MTAESTSVSVAEMLREKMFGGVSNVSNPRFLAFNSHLACSTKQQVAFNLRSREDLRDSLREMLLMVSRLLLNAFLFFSLCNFVCCLSLTDVGCVHGD